MAVSGLINAKTCKFADHRGGEGQISFPPAPWFGGRRDSVSGPAGVLCRSYRVLEFDMKVRLPWEMGGVAVLVKIERRLKREEHYPSKGKDCVGLIQVAFLVNKSLQHVVGGDERCRPAVHVDSFFHEFVITLQVGYETWACVHISCRS